MKAPALGQRGPPGRVALVVVEGVGEVRRQKEEEEEVPI